MQFRLQTGAASSHRTAPFRVDAKHAAVVVYLVSQPEYALRVRSCRCVRPNRSNKWRRRARDIGRLERKASPLQSVATTSTTPESVTRNRAGPSTPPPIYSRPCRRRAHSVVLSWLRLAAPYPSGLICVTHPLSAPPSTQSQLPSANATGPSGLIRPEQKITCDPPLSRRPPLRRARARCRRCSLQRSHRNRRSQKPSW